MSALHLSSPLNRLEDWPPEPLATIPVGGRDLTVAREGRYRSGYWVVQLHDGRVFGTNWRWAERVTWHRIPTHNYDRYVGHLGPTL